MVTWYWHRYVKMWLPWLFVSFIFLAIEGGALGALSYMVRPMFDDIFVAGNRDAVIWVAAVVFFIFVARALAGVATKVLNARIARNVSANVQNDLVQHLLKLDSSFYQINPPGVLMDRVRADPQGASTMITALFAGFGRDVVALISLLGIAISIDWLWALIAVAGGPLLMYPTVLLQRLIRKTNRFMRNAGANITTLLSELFHGINTVKLNGTEKFEGERFNTSVMTLVQAQLKVAVASAGIPALMDIVAAIGFFGVLSYGGFQIIDGEKTIGEFMSFFTAIALLFEPLRRLGTLSAKWQGALVSLERIYTVFDLRPTIVSPPNPTPLPADPFGAELVFDAVEFSYRDDPVLSDVSFVAEAGKTTALVGASGAGKSTVFNLITRLADPKGGSITIGGTATQDFDLAELRGLFSVVTQDAQMFDETIRDNIQLGTEHSEAKLNQALETAHVADFLSSQTEGLDTRVGPRGSALSGGQRQRVAIARAVLRDTPILLLDEATSALDTKSEKTVQTALDNLSENRTTLVIAHRLSTVRNADKIVVMDAGKVVEQGTHDELLKKGGIYESLYRLQFSPLDEPS